MDSTPDIPESTNAPPTIDPHQIGAAAAQVRHSGRVLPFDYHEPIAPQAPDTLFLTPEERAEKRRRDELELKNPDLNEKCLCPGGVPNWVDGDPDAQGRRVCDGCGTISRGFVGMEEESRTFAVTSADDAKKNAAKVRHQIQIDQAARRAMFKLDPEEIHFTIFTDQLLRHANNRLGQALVWCKVLKQERALPNQIFLTPSELYEANRVIRGATKKWINLPEAERKDVKFGSAILWVCGIVLTIKARANGGAFSFPTEELCNMGTMRALHEFLGMFRNDVEYQAEEAKQVSTGNKQPGAARDAIHYITHNVTRKASYFSLGRGDMSVCHKLKELSKLVKAAGVWVNPAWRPGMDDADKFLGLDHRVMTFKRPKCSANANQVKSSSQNLVAVKPRAFGLAGARGSLATRKQLATPVALPDKPVQSKPVKPKPAVDSWSDGEEEGDAMETEEEQWERFQAGNVKGAKVNETAEEKKRLASLEKDLTADAMQANMQANHAQDVAEAAVAVASQEAATETLEYSEAEEEEEEEEATPASSSAAGQVAQDALTAQVLAAHDGLNSGAYSDVDMGEGEGEEEEETDAAPEEETDGESVAIGSDVVGEFDEEKDALPEDLFQDDDTTEAEVRMAAADSEDAFAAALATVEATPAMDLPLGAAVVEPAVSTRINEDGDIDVLAGRRMYNCKEYHLVAKLTQEQALATANWWQGGAKADRWLDTWMKLHKAYKAKVRAKLQKEGKREAALQAVEDARVAKREEAAQKRAALSAEKTQKAGDKQFKDMEKAMEKAKKAASKGDAAAFYYEPTTVLGGQKVLRKLQPQIKVKINLTTKRAAEANAVCQGLEPPKKKAKAAVSQRKPPGAKKRGASKCY